MNPLEARHRLLVALDTPDLEAAVGFARLARDAGLDGVVCSATEAMALRGALGRDFILVVPGIRPTWSEAGDQKRIVTPAEAVALGADYLVVGRPITAADPAEAAARIVAEIEAA